MRGWRRDELDPSIPPVRAYASAWHPVRAAAFAERLADLTYDFQTLCTLMLEASLTTHQLVWRESDGVFQARNPLPVGVEVEDSATHAAAAAFGAYLRAV